MDTSIASIVIMGSQVCASVQTHEIIYIKYVQGFVSQLSLKKGCFFCFCFFLKVEGEHWLGQPGSAWHVVAQAQFPLGKNMNNDRTHFTR